MEVTEILDKIGKDKFIFYSPMSSLITIYDDYIFHRNDYDHLSTRQRSYISKKFLEHGLKQTSGSTFEYGENVVGIQKSIGLGINPIRSLLGVLEKYDYVVATPLSCFLYLISSDAHEDEIYRLLKKCPVNLEQAYNLSGQEEYLPRLERSIAQYREFQSANEATHKFKEL